MIDFTTIDHDTLVVIVLSASYFNVQSTVSNRYLAVKCLGHSSQEWICPSATCQVFNFFSLPSNLVWHWSWRNADRVRLSAFYKLLQELTLCWNHISGNLSVFVWDIDRKYGTSVCREVIQIEFDINCCFDQVLHELLSFLINVQRVSKGKKVTLLEFRQSMRLPQVKFTVLPFVLFSLMILMWYLS